MFPCRPKHGLAYESPSDPVHSGLLREAFCDIMRLRIINSLKTHTCAEYMLREWIQHINVNIAL